MTGRRDAGLVQRIIVGAAERLAQHPAIQPDCRGAFAQAAALAFEQQIVDVIGRDTLRISGWTVLPSERRARRARIVAALRGGRDALEIARAEGVTARWVRCIARDLAGGGEL